MAVPDAASDINVTALGSHSVQIDWTDNSADELGFRIERSYDLVGWQVVETVAADTESYVSNGERGGTTTHFRVVAFNADGDGDASDVEGVELSGGDSYSYAYPPRGMRMHTGKSRGKDVIASA
jgi:hypothetical protein